MRQPSAQHGFSLIELLVTVVIFSIGLLGAAGLQIVSKRATFAAMQRTTATQVASGLLEDMRANGPALATYVATAQIGQKSINGVSSTDCTNATQACTTTEISMRDLNSWETLMDGGMETIVKGAGTTAVGGLVSPVACIAGPVDGSAGVYVVSVAWRGAVALADPGIIACGANSGQYGDANEFRRVIQILTFIDPNL
jgi:type IV pilus assembly protein PilV